MSTGPRASGEADDPGGVLGNLPRSRPGRRSEKRTVAAEETAGATRDRPSTAREAAARSGTRAAKSREAAPRGARRAPAAGGERGRAAARPVMPAPSSEGSGTLEGAARVAGRAARLGLGVLKRLPRP